MKIRLGSGITLIQVFSLLVTAIAFFFPNPVLREIFGVIFLISAPGFILTLAIFPDSWHFDSIERAAFSFGLSIVIVPLLALLLAYMPWGITMESIIVCILLFIFATSLVAWFRLNKLNKLERFSINFTINIQPRNIAVMDRVLILLLTVAILSSISIFVYFLSSSQRHESFTEFYILGSDGTTQNYPKVLLLGQAVDLTTVLVNHEGKETTYQIELMENNTKIKEIGPVILSSEQKWQTPVQFTPTIAGDNQKFELILYKDNGSDPYFEPLFLWISVK